MKKKYILIYQIVFFVILLFSVNINAQPYTIWSKMYNGPANQQDSSVAVTVNSLGMVFVTGWSLGSGTSSDIVTIRYNPNNGDSIWVNRYNSPTNGEDRVTSIACDNNAVYVTGWSFTPSRDIITIKYDALTGSALWVRTYNGSGNGGDYGFSIAVDASGFVYVTGRSDIGGAQKFTTLKYDSNGNMASGWPNVYTGFLSTIFDQAQAIKVDASGNVFVTGKAGTAGTEDFLTLRINSNGTVNWAKRYNGTQNAEDNAVALVLDNTASNVFVGGYSFRLGGVQDYVTIKYSVANGDSLAAATYNGPASSTDQLTCMAIDNANNIYVSGFSSASGTGYDYATIKYNSNLVQQWLLRTSNAGNELPFGIAIDNVSSNVFVTGSSFLTGQGFDYLTVSYSFSGSLNWEKRENGTANTNDYASSIAVFSNDQIYVTGSANFSGSGIVFYTLRYSAVSSVEPISTLIPNEFNLMQNYPNPFNPITNIRFDIPKSANVKITVFDILGREITILVNQYLKAGQYITNWIPSNTASGIYFYTLEANDYKKTQKMIFAK